MKIKFNEVFIPALVLTLVMSCFCLEWRDIKRDIQIEIAKRNVLKIQQCGVPRSMAEKLAASYNIIDSDGVLQVGDIEASGELELIRGYKEISQ